MNRGEKIMKKITAIIFTVVLVFGLETAAMGNTTSSTTPPRAGYGQRCGGTGIMWDENGNFLSKDAFDAKLDKLIKDGVLQKEYKEFYLERYDYCSTYGGGAIGVRGGGCGGCKLGRG